MNAFDCDVSDEELVKQAKSDIAFSQLISRYKKIAEIKARKLGSGRSEAEMTDLIDEGVIALFYAVRTFDESKGVLFSTYADTCITNRIIASLGKQNRIRLKETDESLSSEEIIERESPESILIERERFNEVMKRASKMLSEMELSVLELYMQTESYKIIAAKLNMSQKSVDNAMQRVRKKLKAALSNGK